MPRDRSSPALLELISSESRSASTAPLQRTSEPVTAESISPSASSAASPPRDAVSATAATVRLPIGYVYVGAVAALFLIVTAYFVGQAQGRRALTQEMNQPADSGAGEGINDPTWNTENPSGTANRSNTGGNEGINGGHVAGVGSPTLRGSSDRKLDVDNRMSGLNYIIVERFSPDEAWAAKEFLQRAGIDVMVLPDNNPNLLQLVSRQGFNGWSSNTEAQALDRRLEELGRMWKNRESGSKDFSKRLARRQP